MKRDSKGRFVKSEPEGNINWEALKAVFLILAILYFGMHILPEWYHNFEKEQYNKGYSSALAEFTAKEQGIFDDGFRKGQMIQTLVEKEGYEMNPYSSYSDALYCNDTHCISYDPRYNVQFRFGSLVGWEAP